MAADASRTPLLFDPSAFEAFRFLDRELHEDGLVTLRYGLDEELSFTERLRLPVPHPLGAEDAIRRTAAARAAALGRGGQLLQARRPAAGGVRGRAARDGRGGAAGGALLGGPRGVRLHQPSRPAAAPELLGRGTRAEEAAAAPSATGARRGLERRSEGSTARPGRSTARPERVLVPVGGGKDSAVAIEIVRRSGLEAALFSIGDAPPIARTVAAAGLPWLMARRELDPQLRRLNESGALNGHVPVTAIVTAAALLCAQLNGYDTVAMANERSASAGNLRWDGVEVNHQFSKSLRVERLLDGAVAGAAARPCAPSRSCGPPPSSRSRARSPGSTATTGRSRAATRSSAWTRPCAASLVVLRLPQVPLRVPGARPLHDARAAARDLRARPARGGGPVRGLRAAVRHRGPQAVRVRGGGAGEPRRDPAAGRRRALERAAGGAPARRGGASPPRTAGRETRPGCSS